MTEKPNWFTTKKIKVKRKVWVTDELKCSMCNFKLNPKTHDREKIHKLEQEVIKHAMIHTIQEFYGVWDRDEIWDEGSFQYQLIKSKRHLEETDKIDYHDVPPRITFETVFQLGVLAFFLFITILIVAGVIRV